MTTRSIRVLFIIGGTGLVLVAAAAFWLLRASHPPVAFSPVPESFTFFELGSNTRFSDAVRDDLRGRLGSDAISYRGTIDLGFFDPTLMKTRFPAIFELNRTLNSPPGERVEHDIVKLTYRYAWRRESPFKLVDLVFFNRSGLPLYFVVTMTREGSEILSALIQKYGDPTVFQQESDRLHQIRYWEKNGDILIVSEKPDRLGNPEYQVYIVFVNSIQQLVAYEKQQARQKEDKIRKAADKAF
jgi:hypothetical protein